MESMMSHMPAYGGSGSACSDTGSCGGPRIVEYTASGSELTSGFTVPIGTTLASADYYVTFFGVESDIEVPIAWSFPTASKTTTQFEARFVGALTAAGVYLFQIVEA